MQITDLSFMVVEDHDFQRSTLVRMLKGLNAKCVYAAADGRAALDLLARAKIPVDIIISDISMPVMDGMELIRHVGQRGHRVSIIISSGLERSLLTAVEAMTLAYGIPLLGTIEKPISRETLEAVVSRYAPPAPKPAQPQAPPPAFTLEEILHGLDNHEFEAYFQPKVALATGKVKGAEALARWLHPQQGVVAPAAFIPALEDNGMIDKLLWVMLQKGAEFCGTCRSAGIEGTVAVNLSIKSLADVNLAERVTEVVRGFGAEPRDMVIEVTESAATTDVGRVLENLSRLRMNGFGLSIDDYGTGYSSMQQLTRIPFTELKIDRSFVTNAALNEAAKIILDSSLQLAKHLKIAAVAEGVETQQDWDLLRELGCDIAQGYFIARPMPGAAYCAWIRELESNPMTVARP